MIVRMRLASLTALCLNLTVMSCVMHVSRARRTPGTPAYSPASAVVLTEIGKLIFSLIAGWLETADRIASDPDQQSYESCPTSSSPPSRASQDEQYLYEKPLLETKIAMDAMDGDRQDTVTATAPAPATTALAPSPFPRLGSSRVAFSHLSKVFLNNILSNDFHLLAIPAILFAFQNYAQYIASTHLSVPMFQVTYQLKIPSTAIWAVILLSRRLTKQQWFSILLLPLGIAIIQLTTPAMESSSLPSFNGYASIFLIKKHASNGFVGFVAVILACLSSGFSGCYFERRLKIETEGRRPAGLWIRNIQLAMFSLLVAAFMSISEYLYLAMNSPDVETTPRYSQHFFTGFDSVVWLVILLQISGGLLSALTIKYADNVSKAFSASVSIVLSFGASVWLFDFQLSQGVGIGALIVIAATWLFSTGGAPAPSVALPLRSNYSSTPSTPSYTSSEFGSDRS